MKYGSSSWGAVLHSATCLRHTHTHRQSIYSQHQPYKKQSHWSCHLSSCKIRNVIMMVLQNCVLQGDDLAEMTIHILVIFDNLQTSLNSSVDAVSLYGATEYSVSCYRKMSWLEQQWQPLLSFCYQRGVSWGQKRKCIDIFRFNVTKRQLTNVSQRVCDIFKSVHQLQWTSALLGSDFKKSSSLLQSCWVRSSRSFTPLVYNLGVLFEYACGYSYPVFGRQITCQLYSIVPKRSLSQQNFRLNINLK